MSWSTITRHRSWGGLGIRQSRISNIAFLRKLAWAMLSDHDKLWTHLLREKYRFQGCWQEYEACPNASIIWKSIVRVGNILKEGFQFKIGKGDLSFWFDSWLPGGPLYKNVSYVHVSDSALLVRDVWENGNWKLDGLVTQLPMEVRDRINNYRVWLHTNSVDCCVWLQDTSGKYNVSSCYWCLF